MLEQMRDSLVPLTGRIIIALVLPYKPFVENGLLVQMLARSVAQWLLHAADGTYGKPLQYLDIDGDSWEENVSSLIENVFEPLDLHVEVCLVICIFIVFTQ